MTTRQTIQTGLLVFTLGWLFIEAPSIWWRDIQFVLTILLLTAWTRTTTWQHAAAGIASGIGWAVPLMLGIGWLPSRPTIVSAATIALMIASSVA